jgi:CRP-like cAMP-binding protein
MPPRERLRYLKAAKGIELDDGDALFRIGDLADAFYCIMFGAMSVVMDFARMPAPTLNEFEEIVNRARVHSSFLNPGGTLDTSQDASYVVRTMKPLECFGDVGLLLTNQQRTASVVATEKTLLMKIDRDTFLEMRASNSSRELREKLAFLARVPCVDHWDDDGVLRLCGRMEKLVLSYNDIVTAQGEPASASTLAFAVVIDSTDRSVCADYFYFVAHGDCRLVREYPLPTSPAPPSSSSSSPSKPSQRPKTCAVEICTVGR